MLRLTFLLPLALLAACHGGPPTPREQAKTLIAQQCAACHVVPGVGTARGLVGPSLAGIARQQVIAGTLANNRANMVRWLMHPQQVLPGNAMPEMGLTEAQARLLTDYLYTLDDR